MEPYKFEENVREKLETREIAPSKNAWEKLDAQLDNHEGKSGGKFSWMAIAAGFVGILIIASFVFNRNKISGNFENNSVVEKNVKVDNIENSFQQNGFEDNAVAAEATTPKEKIKDLKSENVVKTNNRDAIAKNLPKKENVKSKDNQSNIDLLEGVAVSLENTNENVLVGEKVDEVINQIKQLKNEKNKVSVAEVDALLAKAQRGLKAERVFNPNKKNVDARSLLQDAEFLADRSFRDKVFYALGEGFEKVRSAVAERNQ